MANAGTASVDAMSAALSVQIAERGLRFAEGDPDRGALLAWLSWGHVFRGRIEEARIASVGALEIARPGTPEWIAALAVLCLAAQALGGSVSLGPYIGRLVTPAEEPEPSLNEAICLLNACFNARSTGQMELAETALARLERIADTVGEQMPLVDAVRQVTRAIWGRFNARWFPLGLASARRAMTIARAAGHRVTEDLADCSSPPRSSPR
jgi:hypothetical protein